MHPKRLAILAIVPALLIAVTTALLWPDSTVNPAPANTTSKRHQDRKPAPHQPAASEWQPLLDDSLPLETRLDLARSIDHQTSQAERAFLFDALTHTPRPDTGQDWWIVMNEIMEQMRKKGIGSDQYSARLGALIRDSSQNEMVRDYAIQHLAQWIAPAGGDITPGEENPAQARLALEAIAAAAADPALAGSTVSGTALMALLDASSRLPATATAATWDSLRPYLAEVITGQATAANHFRISAIQAVALRGDITQLPAIRDLATRDSTDPGLRLSSIAALGLYAAPADRPFLESLATGTTKFRHAAQAALTRYP
jgi:hypothetical protein